MAEELAVSAQEEEKVIDPLTGKELSQEDIDTEVQSRIDAIEFATKEEIIAALKNSSRTARAFLTAFSEKEMPRLTKNEIVLIASANSDTPPSVQINNLNKSGLFPRQNLKIESETTEGTNQVVNRVLCNTRIKISGQPVLPATLALHQAVRETIPTQDPQKAELLELIVDQYLGIPLATLSAYLDLEPADISSAIESINEDLKHSKVKIHIRHGVAIIGDINGYITLFDNAETRKNIFPKKKGKEDIQKETTDAKATRLESELSAALAELATEKEKTAELTAAREDLHLSNLRLQGQVDGLLNKLESKTDTTALEKQLAQKSATILTLEADVARLTGELKDADLTKAQQDLAQLAEKDAALAKAQQDLAQLTQQVADLTEEVRIANELLESATDSSKPSAANPASTIKKANPETASPKTFNEQIKKIEKTSYRREVEIYDDVITALNFRSGNNSLTKKQIDQLQTTVTKINLGGDQLTHQHRIKIARLLKELKGKGDEIQAADIDVYIEKLSDSKAREEITNEFERERHRGR